MKHLVYWLSLIELGILRMLFGISTVVHWIFLAIFNVFKFICKFRVPVFIAAYVFFMDMLYLSPRNGKYIPITTEINAVMEILWEHKIMIALSIAVFIIYEIIFSKIYYFIEGLQLGTFMNRLHIEDAIKESIQKLVDKKAAITTATSMSGSERRRMNDYRIKNTNYRDYSEERTKMYTL